MTIERRFYALLGVSQTAKQAQIKAAYRKVAKTMHPDVGGDPEAFIELTKAYHTLHDPELRKAYDLTGEVRDENAMALQKGMVMSIAAAYEAFLTGAAQQGVPIEAINIIEGMVKLIGQNLAQMEHQRNSLEQVLRSFQKSLKRIKRQGDGKNLFADIAETRIKELSDQLIEIERNLRMGKMVIDEISRHKDEGELFRFMHAGMWPSSSSSSAGGGFYTIILS